MGSAAGCGGVPLLVGFLFVWVLCCRAQDDVAVNPTRSQRKKRKKGSVEAAEGSRIVAVDPKLINDEVVG